LAGGRVGAAAGAVGNWVPQRRVGRHEAEDGLWQIIELVSKGGGSGRRVGEVVEAGPVVVTADAIKAFAAQFDPQPSYPNDTAPDAAVAGQIASGLQITCLDMRLLVDAFLCDTKAMGSPGVEEVCYFSVVRAGDSLTTGSGVWKAARSRSSRSPIVPSWPRSSQPFDGGSIPADARSTPRSSRTLGLARGSSVAHSRPALRLCPCHCLYRAGRTGPRTGSAIAAGEHARPLPLAVTEDAGRRDLDVVIPDRLWHAAEECKRPNVAVAEGFRRLCRIANHEAGV
jgi:acyl dehydratase